MSLYPEREDTMVERGSANLSAFGRFVMWLQIFSWNVACLSSLIVVTVFWGLLVRTRAFSRNALYYVTSDHRSLMTLI